LFVWDSVKEPLKTQISKFNVEITYLNSVFKPTPPGSEALAKDWGLSAAEVATLLTEERERYVGPPPTETEPLVVVV
jgi:hypothetical protein